MYASYIVEKLVNLVNYLWFANAVQMANRMVSDFATDAQNPLYVRKRNYCITWRYCLTINILPSCQRLNKHSKMKKSLVKIMYLSTTSVCINSMTARDVALPIHLPFGNLCQMLEKIKFPEHLHCIWYCFENNQSMSKCSNIIL